MRPDLRANNKSRCRHPRPGRFESQFALDLGEGHTDIPHISAEGQILIFDHGLRHALEHQVYDLILGVISVLCTQVVDLSADLASGASRPSMMPRTTSRT